MSISEILIKGIGVVLAIVGLLLVLSVVGLSVGVGLDPWPIALLVGALLIGVGIYIVRGGGITA